MTQLLPPKKEVALALLERSNVDVYLDPRANGVVVPPQFKKEPRLILKIGLNMPVPIPDLRLDDESMSCTLSFSRSPFYCVVPWGSVFAMVGEDGRGMVWPDDVPQELAVRIVDERAPAPVPDAAPREREAKPASSGRGRGRGKKEPAAEVALAEEPRPARGKKSKKKKEAPARPVLVALPSPPPEQEVPRINRGGQRAGDGGRDGSRAERQRVAKEAPRAPVPVPHRAPPPSRPKRELPPYLRVVK